MHWINIKYSPFLPTTTPIPPQSCFRVQKGIGLLVSLTKKETVFQHQSQYEEWNGGEGFGNRKIKEEKNKCIFFESVQLYVVLSGTGRSSKIVDLISLFYDKCTFLPSRLFLLSFHFCLSDSLPYSNATEAPSFWQRSFWVGFLWAPSRLPPSLGTHT